MVMELVKQKSVASHFIAELRDVDIQKDPMRFRRNLERIGEVIAHPQEEGDGCEGVCELLFDNRFKLYFSCSSS